MDERTRKHINDDKETSHIEKSNHTPEKKKGLTKTQKIIATGIILVALVGGGLAYNIYNNNHNTTPNETGSNSSQTTTPEKPVLTAAERLEATYGAAMEKYKNMSVDAFEALPRDERLLYSQYLIDLDTAKGNYDKWYGADGPGKAYAITSTPVSIDNNGQEIVNNELYTIMVSSYQSSFNNGELTYNKDSGEKMLSSAYYAVGKDKALSDSYIGVKSEEETQTDPNYVAGIYTVINTSKLLNGKDKYGEAIQYKIVAYHTQDNYTSYARYIYHEFNTHKSIWLLDDQSDIAMNIR